MISYSLHNSEACFKPKPSIRNVFNINKCCCLTNVAPLSAGWRLIDLSDSLGDEQLLKEQVWEKALWQHLHARYSNDLPPLD